MKRILTFAAVLTLLVPATLVAQGRGAGRGGWEPDGPPRARGEMMLGHGLGFGPSHLLARRQALDLTAQQISRLEALEREVHVVEDATRSAVREHSDALREAWNAETLDADAVRTHTRALMEARQTLELARLDAALEARSLLDDGQRGRVEGWMDAGRAMGPRGRQAVPRRAPRGLGFRRQVPK